MPWVGSLNPTDDFNFETVRFERGSDICLQLLGETVLEGSTPISEPDVYQDSVSVEKEVFLSVTFVVSIALHMRFVNWVDLFRITTIKEEQAFRQKKVVPH